jgi:predicted ATPase
VTLLRERVPSFDEYPFAIPAIRGLDEPRFDPGVTFLIGENGSGKSTLVEAIAILAGFNPEGGTRHFRFAARPSESRLHESLRLARSPQRERAGFFLRAETLFNLATEVEQRALAEYGWEDMHAKSHGEAFLWLVTERFRPGGLYILDEPEAALSPQRQLALLRLIHDLVQAEPVRHSDAFTDSHGVPRRDHARPVARGHRRHVVRGHRALPGDARVHGGPS